LIYQQTDGFTNMDINYQYLFNHLGEVDFDALLPQQEHLFQMIRSCVFEGDATQELLSLMNLEWRLEKAHRHCLSLINQIDLKRAHQSKPQLPASLLQGMEDLTWGPHVNNSESIAFLHSSIRALRNGNISVSGSTRDVQWDLNQLELSMELLANLIDLSDCDRVRSFYELGVDQFFCKGFINDLRSVSHWFGWALVSIVSLFFVSCCVGHRVFARLNKSCKNNIRPEIPEDPEDPEDIDEDLPYTAEAAINPGVIYVKVPDMDVEEKKMPTYPSYPQQPNNNELNVASQAPQQQVVYFHAQPLKY